jgi:hypothetical protein
VKKEVKELFSSHRVPKPDLLREQHVLGLPEPVQKCIRHGGFIGRERVRTVRLRQRGSIRLKKEQRWMSFAAEQYYTTDPPAFIWNGRMKLGPLALATARDRYDQGRGSMVVKLLSLYKVVNASGRELDQGAMVRYLNEAMWFPAAYLNSCIQWEAVDDASAKATMSFEGTTASATLHFSRDGTITNFVAERYMTVGSEYRLETWSTPISEYAEIRGVRIPVKGTAVWNLSDGDFEYIRTELTDIEYNNASAY